MLIKMSMRGTWTVFKKVETKNSFAAFLFKRINYFCNCVGSLWRFFWARMPLSFYPSSMNLSRGRRVCGLGWGVSNLVAVEKKKMNKGRVKCNFLKTDICSFPQINERWYFFPKFPNWIKVGKFITSEEYP